MGSPLKHLTQKERSRYVDHVSFFNMFIFHGAEDQMWGLPQAKQTFCH